MSDSTEIAATTAGDVVNGADLSGYVAVVTGASSGLGAETARALASVGAEVILAARDTQAADRVAATIRDRHPQANVDVAALDLTSLENVRAFADSMAARFDRVDILVNNAGVMATPFQRTTEGFESQLGTNHLGHFLLTNRLRPNLERSGRARVVNVSSAGHAMSDVIWDDPNFVDHPYDKWTAYGQSKTANILFAVALDGRLSPHGGNAFSVHPGMVATNLARYLDAGDLKVLMQRGRDRAQPDATAQRPARVPVLTVEVGAATSVWAAVAADRSLGGGYLADCAPAAPAPYAADPDGAERLWALSEVLVGEKFS